MFSCIQHKVIQFLLFLFQNMFQLHETSMLVNVFFIEYCCLINDNVTQGNLFNTWSAVINEGPVSKNSDVFE